ncbi:MAG: bifunctional diaminohydroxyphosphoribosylaminopyrimidine deaminase/5-amino-6-(5-phosphoribosylamino)uracil reductase RibD [Deltaproteobacteria bacterium]|nr:bifunctional diaminohydroxyphosphoribosylaminopyrimidine deaminase/5-amino-6-(5-phosphoribosylamino)uracil reductase RibD [Deltaproteobacteria bacterium]
MNAIAHSDDDFMREALAEAARARGNTGDNPPVGCVIVRDGRIIGRGCTQHQGGAHAEVMAVAQAESTGHSVSGAQVTVTLEPCAFTGRTPPCAGLLIEKKPARVVIGAIDPHPMVNGEGIRRLREAGIEVVVGVMESEVREFLADWFLRHEKPGGP